jgi:hypothetical protein
MVCPLLQGIKHLGQHFGAKGWPDLGRLDPCRSVTEFDEENLMSYSHGRGMRQWCQTMLEDNQ